MAQPPNEAQANAIDEHDTRGANPPSKKPARDKAAAPSGTAAKRYRQRGLCGPQKAQEGAETRSSSNNKDTTRVRHHEQINAIRHWACAKCAHHSYVGATPTKQGRAPTKRCPGCGQTRRVTTATCSDCPLTLRKRQCGRCDIQQENNEKQAPGNARIRVQRKYDQGEKDAAERSGKKVRVSAPQAPTLAPAERASNAEPELQEPSKWMDPTERATAPDAKNSGGIVACEARNGYSVQSAPTAGKKLQARPPNAQKYPSSERRSYQRSKLFPRSQAAHAEGTREARGQTADMDDTATTQEGPPSLPRVDRTRHCYPKYEGQQSSVPPSPGHRRLKRPAPKQNTPSEGNKHRCTLRHGANRNADATVGTIPKARGTWDGRSTEPEGGNQTAGPPAPGTGRVTPHQGKRQVSWSGLRQAGPCDAAKRTRFTSGGVAHACGRQHQKMHAPAVEGTERDASPQEPQPRLHGRGWHDRWPPPAIGGCGRGATEVQ